MVDEITDDPYLVPKKRVDDPNRAALEDPHVQDFLGKISKSEGADYTTLVGGRQIKDLSRHPNIVGLTTSAGPSTAFGRYQITGTTNRTKLKKYADLDYSPENQDLRAVELLRQTKALDALQQGDETTAIKRAGREWASLPGSPLPGRKNLAAFAQSQDPYLVPKTKTPTETNDPYLVAKPTRPIDSALSTAVQGVVQKGAESKRQRDVQAKVAQARDRFAGVKAGAGPVKPTAGRDPFALLKAINTQPSPRSPDDALREQAVKNVTSFTTDPVANVRSLIGSARRGTQAQVDTEAENEFQNLKAQQARATTPEMTGIRKEYGQMKPAVRSIAAPLARTAGDILKITGGLTSLAGLTPNQYSEWANKRGQIVQEGASLSPLSAADEEIKRGLPEKITAALADTGLSIAEIVLLKKATGLPLGRLLALETALKTSDEPLAKRAPKVAESAAMGKLLEGHLSRPASAAAFGAPTAAREGQAYLQNNTSLEDAILQTAVQSGVGAALGGKLKGAERVAEAEAQPNVPAQPAEIKPASGAPEPVARTPELPRSVLVQREDVNQPSGPENIVIPPAVEAAQRRRAQRELEKESASRPVETPVIPAEVRQQEGARTAIQTPPSPDEVKGKAGEPHPETGRKFSSTQVNLPPEAAKLQQKAAMEVADADLKEVDGTTREERAHITVKYGLHTENPVEVERLLANEPPIKAKVGKVSIFPAKEGADYDVVKMDVDSPDLHRLNAKIAKGTKVTDTHPEYKPHVTLAYVKAGEGAKYVGKTNALTGQEITINEVLFSGRGGQKANIKLSQIPPKEVSNETTALSKANQQLRQLHIVDEVAGGQGTPETVAPPAPSNVARGRDITDKSLAQAVRSEGGIRIDIDKANKGELARLSNRETGTTGLVNQNGKHNAEQMALRMAEEGYRGDWVDVTMGPHGPQYAVDGNKFLEAVEMDQRGITPSLHGEKDISYEAEYRKAHQEEADAHDARISLIESDGGGKLYDKVIAGEANESDLREFREVAKGYGVTDEDIGAFINEGTKAQSAARQYVPNTPRSKAEQLGFVQEGLTQESVQPKADTSTRERLRSEEEARQRAANPERAAAMDTLAELRRKGMTVDDYARQGSLLSETPTPEKIALLRELEKGGKPAVAEQPSFVTSAMERQAKRAAEKEQGIEYRRSGADPYELIDNITIKGWELYSQKIKPTFEEWSRKIRDEFGPESESHLRKIWTQLGGLEPSSTAAKREKVTKDRAARGEEPIAKPERKSDESLLSDAKQANAKDPNEPLRLVDQVLNGKKGALSDKETVQVDLHVQKLKNEYDAVNKQLVEAKDAATIKDLSEKSDAMEREMRASEEAFAKSGTEKGRALRAQRIEIDQDFRLLTMVSKATKAHGRELTRDERATIQEQHDKIADLETKLTESNERAAKAEAARAVTKIKSDVARENRRAGRGLKRESLDQEAAQLKQLIAQAWKRQSGGSSGEIHSAMGLAKLDPEGVVTKLVVQLARNRVEAHIGLKAEALVDEVHGLLKDAVDLSRRDVAEMISGYGKTFEMSQDKVDTRLRELKSIIASNLGRADIIEKGIRPLRRGLQRDKPTQEVRAAMRELRDTLREHGMQVERSKGSPEEQQQSSLDAAKTRTKNRIEDLTKWIADGKRTVANKVEIIPDAELKTLQGERDRLQKVFEAIVDPAADQKKIENAVRTVEKSVADLEAKIRAGNTAPKPRPPGLTSPELNAARAEQKALRGILTDLRNAAKPEPDAIEVEARKLLSAQKSLSTRMEKQIGDLERRMKQGDFSEPSKRQPVPYSRENLVLQKQLEQIKHEYAKANYRATRGRFGLITDELAKAANVPKTLKSMADISAVFRQGGFYALTHPIEGLAKPSAAMLRSFSETGYRNVEQAIQNHPKFDQAKRDGVEFTGVDKNDPRLSHKEEGYFGGETIDVLASGKYNPLRAVKGVKDFSERTFVSFLDSQRMHMYDLMTEGLKAQGLTPRNAPESYKGAAKLINIGTGRGNLGKKGNQAAPFLNILMFSPRLVASRVQLLNNMFDPVAMARMPKGVRAQNIKDNVKFLAATSAVMGLATAVGGTINYDPDDADFLKIRFGKTTYDTLTGLQQPLRYILNMTRAATGGETYPGQSMADLTTRFARSKASPLTGLAVDAITGEDFRGRKFNAKRAALDVVTPLPANDFIEAMKKEGLIKGFIKATPSLTGIGVQTYDERPDKPKTQAEKLARKMIRDSMPDKARDDEQIDKDDKKAELRARARKGEDVKAELDQLDLTKRQRKAVLDAKGKTRLQEDFNHLGVEEAVIVYETMSADERKQTLTIMKRKKELIKNLPKEKQEKVKDRLRKLGLMAQAPTFTGADFQRYFPKSQSASA